LKSVNVNQHVIFQIIKITIIKKRNYHYQ
jgi:hypothetical protein